MTMISGAEILRRLGLARLEDLPARPPTVCTPCCLHGRKAVLARHYRAVAVEWGESIYLADTYKCPVCGHIVVGGFAKSPTTVPPEEACEMLYLKAVAFRQ